MNNKKLVRIDFYNNMGGIYDPTCDDEWVQVDSLIAEGDDAEISKAIDSLISEEVKEYEKVMMWFEEDDHVVGLLEASKRNLLENKDLSLACPLRSINHRTEHFWEYKII